MADVALPYAAIPYYGDPAGAVQDSLKSKGPFSNNRIMFKVPGQYFYYPIYLGLGLITDATVGTREALVLMLDANGVEIGRMAVSGTQPAGIGYAYTWNITTGSGYGSGNAQFSAPLPPRLLAPGESFGVQVNGLAGGDTGDVIATVIKIPTGGDYSRATQAEPLPTPLLL